MVESRAAWVVQGRRSLALLLVVLLPVLALGLVGWGVWIATAPSRTALPGTLRTIDGSPSISNGAFRVSVTNFGAKGDGVNNDAASFQSAIDDASSHGGGTVLIPKPRFSYRITRTVQLAGNVSVVGAGASQVMLTGGVPHGNMFLARPSSGVSNIRLTGFSINLNHLDPASGIGMQRVSDVTIDGLRILNVGNGTGDWGIHIGADQSGVESTVPVNHNITVSNNVFDGINGKYEQLLLFNTQDAKIQGNRFSNVAWHSSGGSLGLYQNDFDFLIQGNTFGPHIGNNCIYYAIGDRDLRFVNNTFMGNGSQSVRGDVGIKGANESDHGLFGQLTADDLTITGNRFTGLRIAVQLGGVNGATVTHNTFSQNRVALLVNSSFILRGVSPGVRGAPTINLTNSANAFSQNGQNQTSRVAGSRSARSV